MADPPKYDTIGINYDETRKADPFLVERFYELLQTKKAGNYIDIGCGTGNYTGALHKKGLRITGVDPSLEMLSKAKVKHPHIDWIQNEAENLKLPNDQFNGAISCLTLHHWTNLEIGFKEISRVLTKGSKYVIFTTLPEQTGGYWLQHYFPKMLNDSVEQLPSFAAIETHLTNAGFTVSVTEKYFVKPDLQDQFLYCGKHDPKLYFNKNIRNGISSFSSLANEKEVIQGLKCLRADIDSQKIDSIKPKYENDLGDYLFIVAEKSL